MILQMISKYVSFCQFFIQYCCFFILEALFIVEQSSKVNWNYTTLYLWHTHIHEWHIHIQIRHQYYFIGTFHDSILFGQEVHNTKAIKQTELIHNQIDCSYSMAARLPWLHTCTAMEYNNDNNNNGMCHNWKTEFYEMEWTVFVINILFTSLHLVKWQLVNLNVMHDRPIDSRSSSSNNSRKVCLTFKWHDEVCNEVI